MDLTTSATQHPGGGRQFITLHGLFEAQVLRRPEAPAVVQDGNRLSYAQLDAQADAIARTLAERGVGASQVVAIALERSPDLIAALLGVLKTGAAYLPIDTSYPAERIGYLIENASPVCVITDATTSAQLPQLPQLLVEAVGTEPAGPLPDRRVLPDEAAYVVYTSGSTGRPKGVVISHRSVANYLSWMLDEFGVHSDDRMLQKTPAGFDGAVLEFFWPLISGAALVLARPGGHREPEYIAELIERESVTIAQFMPSMLPVFLEDGLAKRCTSLRRAFSASEALPVPVMLRFRERLGAELINLYGPTEATVDAAFFRCSSDDAGSSVPIGKPIRNMRVEVLDAAMRRVAPGETGELYLAGVQLARGYLGRPGLTADRFVAYPYGVPGERAYRTGDLGRLRPDGLLEFAGRADGQVKIGGVRIEPGEIEAALAEHPAVMQAAVVPQTGPSDELRLVAFVVAWNGQPVSAASIRDYLRTVLPEALVPSAVVFLDELPTTPNEKIDRAALAVLRPASTGSAIASDGSGLGLLLGLTCEVLGAETSTADDNFIGLGGDSISAIRLASRAREGGLRISTADVLRCRTLGELAARAGTTTAGPAGPIAEGVGPFPATPIMHWLRELAADADGFSQSMVLRTPAGATESQLLACLQAIIDRHDMLRAQLPDFGVQGRWQPSSLPPGTVNAASLLEVVRAPDGELADLVRDGLERARTRLRASAPNLLSAVWFDRAARQGRLAVVVQHLAIDGMSLRILQADLETAWRTLIDTGAPELAPVPVPFRHWAELLDQDALSARRRTELLHWTATGNRRSTRLAHRALDRNRDTVAGAGSYRLELAAEHAEPLLNRAPGAFGTNVNAVLITGLVLALASWQQPQARRLGGDFRVAFEGHGREEIFEGVDLSQTVGWFTSLFPAHLRLDGIELAPSGDAGAGFGRAVTRIGEQLAAIPDKGIGYGQLRYLNPDTAARLAAADEPDLLFNYLGRFAEAATADWAFDAEYDVAMDQFDATMPLAFAVEVNSFAIQREEGLVLTAEWKWAQGAVDGEDCRRLAELWFTMLTRLAEQADHGNRLGEPGNRTATGPSQPTTHDDIEHFDSEFTTF